MKKVIDPIVHNAIKFSSTGQKVHVTVSFVETEARRFLQYKVTDEGCGMDPEQQSQALEPFCNSEYEGGLGLGLNIALLMIDSLGGCLGINSPGIGLGTDVMVAIPLEVGGTKGCPSTLTPSFFFKLHESCSPILRQQLLWLDCKIWDEHCGSDFDVLVLDSDFVELSSFQKSTCPIINITSDATLRNPSGIERHAIVVKPVLPNKLRDAIRTHVSAGSDETAEGQETRKRALVVDDIRLNRMLLIKNLAMKMKMKIDFDEAQNGVEALHLAMSSAHVYDIVLLDCNMPIMDGFETAQSLRELPRYKNIPIFAVTANDSIFDHAKCFSSGMDRVISKPVNFPVLVQEIRTAFEYPNERPFRMLCISDGDSSLDSRISVYNMALQPPLHEMSSIVNHSIQKDESMAISQIGTSLRPALRRNVSSIVAHPGLSQNMSNTTAHPGLRRNMSHIVAHPGLRRNMSKVVAHPGLGRNMSNIVAHPGPGRNMSNVGIPSGFGGNMAGHPASGRQLSGVTEQAGLHRKMPSGTCPARQLPSPPRESGVPERGFQDCMISGPEGRSRWPSLHSWSNFLPKLQVHNVLAHSSSAPADCPLRAQLALSAQEGQ
jgi:CheY-like chemotaxis protein